MAELFIKARHVGPGDDYFGRAAEMHSAEQEQGALALMGQHPLDGKEAREELRRLLQWYYWERDKQAENRLEMATDSDFYDNLQWSDEDAAAVKDRGQMPLVYNEIAPMVDWVIGTERRNRVDWRVLPRAEDDVELADIKTKVLKYVSDVNRVPFARSRAFADAVKVGVGWLDDGVRDDPTADVLYTRYEDWRHVLWDSAAYELDLSDARYIFRWRWVDEDVALMMFPDRADAIRSATEQSTRDFNAESDDTWQAGITNPNATKPSGTLFASGVGALADAQRRRIKLIECQYRKPTTVQVVADGPLRGGVLHEQDGAMLEAIGASGSRIVDRLMMRVHVAVFTETQMLSMGPSVFRHNQFSLTPIWCYRRNKDRMPYGVVRRVRDMQQDLNKRASKALFLLNTNQVIADEGAVEDWNLLMDEVARPDGLIVKRPGKQLDIRRDTDAATGQIQMMTLAAQSIQKSAGVSNENLGRQTNAVSGEAIKARQLQGSVVTTEPYDNLRLATQIQGEKQLSLTEQFYSEAKVIRLTGAKGALEWVRINQPEPQPDGSIRYINDITASMADFVVSEQDYSGTLRQMMFDSLNQMATRLPPEVSLRLLTIAMDFSDLPNKDEIADQIRKITGERDPNKEPTPEEAQAMQQQMQQQAEALQYQREQAMAALAEQQAKVREINARAAKLEAESAMAGAGQDAQASAEQAQAMQQAVMQVQQQAADHIEKLTQELRKAQSELANRTIQIKADADTKLTAARIDADTKLRVAEIQASSNAALEAITRKLDGVAKGFEDRLKDQEVKAKERELAQREAMAKKEAAEQAQERESAKPAPAAPAPAPQPIAISLTVPPPEPVTKHITLAKDASGNIVGAQVVQTPVTKQAGADKKPNQDTPKE